MNREQIEAEFDNFHDDGQGWAEHCLQFAQHIAKLEREECAVTAWSTGMSLHMKESDAREIGSACAKAIRARG